MVIPWLLLAPLLALPNVRDVDRVVVVRNDDSALSRAVAGEYMSKRHVKYVVSVHCQDSSLSAEKETIQYPAYVEAIEKPLRAFLARHPRVDFIVLTKGVPIRIMDAPGQGLVDKMPSLDSYLAALDYDKVPGAVRVHIQDGGFTGTAWANRYWDARKPFTHARFGGYLVTRLDGYTEADAIALVDRAIQAERSRPTGEVLLNTSPGHGFGDAAAQPEPIFSTPPVSGAKPVLNELGYRSYNADMVHAADLLKARGALVELDRSGTFVGGRTGLMGYVSWGSNDGHFDSTAYHSLRFAPGGICETAVSTSARTFLPTTGGQSLIADLIAQGATGAKGYVNEPLLQAVASPSILLDRYTRGFTLAESFYAASRFVGWEDVVLGDPLCRPYRRRAERRSGPADRRDRAERRPEGKGRE